MRRRSTLSLLFAGGLSLLASPLDALAQDTAAAETAATVTAVRETDRAWRIVGYFVR
jgi:hypothetical protein